MWMKAIPTVHNGVVFRSKLEARWAKFFDLKRMLWVYEPESIQLPTRPYTPDFYLPDFNTYVEVKPTAGMFDIGVMDQLADTKKANVLLLDFTKVVCRSYVLRAHGSPHYPWHEMFWCASDKYLSGRPDEAPRFYVNPIYKRSKSAPCPHCLGDDLHSVDRASFPVSPVAMTWIEAARAVGVTLSVDGSRLVMEASQPPPDKLIEHLRRNRWDIIEALKVNGSKKNPDSLHQRIPLHPDQTGD